MINYKEKIATLICDVTEGLEIEEVMSMVEVPSDSKMGDYAFPCFKLAKTLRKAPPLIAKDIAEKLAGSDTFEKVENVNAYVNMFLSKKEFMEEIVKEAVLAG
ncbi:MAG: arginine--tRNA ligase, partial [Lachnospiraceae bacterium]|nr:arginine--tRNA ligase [Lachnospiraceae bacterium]